MTFQSNHKIGLTPEVHGLVARYAIKNHIMMDSAVTTIFLRGLAECIDQVLEPVQVRSGIAECQPTGTGEGLSVLKPNPQRQAARLEAEKVSG